MSADKVIKIEEVLKARGPRRFVSMVKPGGSTCNLNCTYCYYLDKVLQFADPDSSTLLVQKMPLDLLEIYIKQYFETEQSEEINFCFHGGEPLVLGLDYYREAMKIQKKYSGGRKVLNTLQTNGLLVNEQWARFFAQNHFLVGISIDGPKDIHDAYRLNKGGAPTFDKVMNAIRIFQQFKVDFNTLSVVNDRCAGRGAEIYDFMKSIGSHYMQFLPAVEHTIPLEKAGAPRSYTTFNRDVIVPPEYPGAEKAPWSISARDYGQFLIDIFDKWVKTDVGTYYVQMFDATLCQWVGVQPGVCSMGETCGEALVVEYNGDVYPCDHFVYPQYKLGNIREKHLIEIFEDPIRLKFGLDKRNTLPEECRHCRYYFECRGECPKHRFEVASDGERKNSLCEGLKMYFEYVDPYMRKMAELLRQQLPPSMIMKMTIK